MASEYSKGVLSPNEFTLARQRLKEAAAASHLTELEQGESDSNTALSGSDTTVSMVIADNGGSGGVIGGGGCGCV